MEEAVGQRERQRRPLSPADIVAATPLLDRLPHPVLWIGGDFTVRWLNASARSTFDRTEGQCHSVTHGFPSPCNEHGEPCPHRSAATSGIPISVGQVRRHEEGFTFFKVVASPVLGGGILEYHVPLDDVLARDSLTGAYSRPFFEHLVRWQLALLERMGLAFSVAMLDLDHFKPINDRLGHPVGDAILRGVGQAIRASCRSADAVGRLGGDEFCLFLPNTATDQALVLVDRLRQALRGVSVPDDGEESSVTASVGIHCDTESYDLEAAIARADEALYQAKSGGRDRVVVL